MSTEAGRADVDRLGSRLARALAESPLGRHGWLHAPLPRLLARGEPVGVADLAEATGQPEDRVRQVLADWTDTEYDSDGRIVGYGITLNPTPHRFVVDGVVLYTWCALDTLAFPALLGRPAEVSSPCAATGEPVRLHVDPRTGVSGLSPATAVVSMVAPEALDSVRAAFCNQVHFFASARAAAPWLAEHPGTTVVPVADAWRLGQRLDDVLQDERSAG
jgi:alkylmercury lyase